MSFKDFDDDYLVLSPQLQQQLQPSSMSLTFSNFNSSSISSTTTTTPITTNSVNSKPQRRTSNFFPPAHDNTGLTTPIIPVTSDSFSFQTIPDSSSNLIEHQQYITSTTSSFDTFNNNNHTYTETPVSPFFNKSHSLATSTISSPVLHATYNQPTFNRLDYNNVNTLSNNLSNLTIQSLSTSILPNNSSIPQTPKQHQSLPQTPRQPNQQRFNGFMISTSNSSSSCTTAPPTQAATVQPPPPPPTTTITTANDFALPQPALSIWNNNNFDIEPSQQLMKRENRYLNKVNNPVFIPSGPQIPESNSLDETVTLLSYIENAIDDDEDEEKIEPIESIEQKSEESQNNNNDDHEDCPRIRFPVKVPYTARNDYFIQDMVNYDLTNRYSEGYSTTFYKRNKHGYMFIREATNTLHVHQNSWIQLKIKLPVNNHKKLLIKKLKVDIKELPIWKPKS